VRITTVTPTCDRGGVFTAGARLDTEYGR
jgi:hypothetical protein